MYRQRILICRYWCRATPRIFFIANSDSYPLTLRKAVINASSVVSGDALWSLSTNRKTTIDTAWFGRVGERGKNPARNKVTGRWHGHDWYDNWLEIPVYNWLKEILWNGVPYRPKRDIRYVCGCTVHCPGGAHRALRSYICTYTRGWMYKIVPLPCYH